MIIVGSSFDTLMQRTTARVEKLIQGSSFFRPSQVPATDGSSSSSGGTPSAGSIIIPGNRDANSPNAVSSFVGSSGHTLGGGSANRRVTDARAARLQALERRGENAV